MAGRPKERQSEQRLLTLGPHAEGLIWNALYAGQSVRQIALTFGYTFKTLTDWVYDPARAATLKRVREQSADHLVAEALRIADGPYTVPEFTSRAAALEAQAKDSNRGVNCRPAADASTGETFADAARDKLRIQHRQWLASRWNKETYGAQPQVQVNVDARSLHIDALRRQPSSLQTTERLLTASKAQPVDSKGVPAASPAEPPGTGPLGGVRRGGSIPSAGEALENIPGENVKKNPEPENLAIKKRFRAAAQAKPAAKGVEGPPKVFRNPGGYISPTRKAEMEKEAKKAARREKKQQEKEGQHAADAKPRE